MEGAAGKGSGQSPRPRRRFLQRPRGPHPPRGHGAPSPARGAPRHRAARREPRCSGAQNLPPPPPPSALPPSSSSSPPPRGARSPAYLRGARPVPVPGAGGSGLEAAAARPPLTRRVAGLAGQVSAAGPGLTPSGPPEPRPGSIPGTGRGGSSRPPPRSAPVQRGAVPAAGDAAPSPCPAACGRRGCCKCSVTAPRWQPARRALLLLALLFFFPPFLPSLPLRSLFIDRDQRPRARELLRGMPTPPGNAAPSLIPKAMVAIWVWFFCGRFFFFFLLGSKFGADCSSALNSSRSLAGGEREASDDMTK